MSRIIRRLANLIGVAPRNRPDGFLDLVRGVIHVGANSGQERDLYRRHGLRVVWVEPIPEVFRKLQENIDGYPNQTALQALVTDLDDVEYEFHVSNNYGASSSILDLKLHRDIWPDVDFDRTISLRSVTLPSLLATNRIPVAEYDALVLDTQGSELLVLKGATPVLREFTYIKTEAADFEIYSGCCQLDELSLFLEPHGFVELTRHRFAERAEGGSCFDVLYRRRGRR